MADLSFLAKVTEYFASGQTVVNAILRRYLGEPIRVEGSGGGRAKGDFDSTPITLYENPETQRRQTDGGGVVQDYDKVFYTRAEAQGPDEFTAGQGDEIIIVDTQDIYQIERLNPWRKGLGDELFCKRVGRVGYAPY